MQITGGRWVGGFSKVGTGTIASSAPCWRRGEGLFLGFAFRSSVFAKYGELMPVSRRVGLLGFMLCLCLWGLSACGDGADNAGDAPTATPGSDTPGNETPTEPPDGNTDAETDGAGGDTPSTEGASDPTSDSQLNAAATLSGDYVGGLAIEAALPSVLEGGAPVALTFSTQGLVEVRQFEVVVQMEPAGAFDASSATFEPASPFLTFGPGAESRGEGALRIGGASLGKGQNGTAVLGTLRLNAAAAMAQVEEVVVRVTFFSVGPSSSLRDNYAVEQLSMQVQIK
jgi:hypothetical protein